MSHASVSERLFGTLEIDEADRIHVVRRAYGYLILCIACAAAGGYFATHVPALVDFLSRPIGYMVGLVIINITPQLAIWASKRDNWPLRLLTLGLNGFLTGVAMSPLLFLASRHAPGALPLAAMLSAGAFGLITLLVLVMGAHFIALALTLMVVTLVGLLGAVLMALFHVPLLPAALSLVFILFGAVQLILATGLLLTSDELGEEFSEPVVAALLLYAGMFHIFQGILSLLRNREED